MLHVNIWTRGPIIRLLEAEVTERETQTDKRESISMSHS